MIKLAVVVAVAVAFGPVIFAVWIDTCASPSWEWRTWQERWCFHRGIKDAP